MALKNSSSKKFRFCRNHAMGIVAGVITFTILIHFLLPENSRIYSSSTFQNLNSFMPTKWCSFDIDEIENNLLEMDQKDSQLIKYVRARYLTPPSNLPYSLKRIDEGKKTDYRDQFSDWVANFFGNKRNGIFIEAGANQGEDGSHTLFLERELGWSGLLIECNPSVVPVLKSHHRKAWVASACLAPSTTPGILNFSNPTSWSYSGTFKKPWNLPVKSDWTFFDVETVPLYSVLASIGMFEVDFFSFDIEGVELSVLKAFPFDLVTFKVLIIEVMFYNEAEKKELNDLLTANGYYFVKNMQVDRIYVHNSVKHMLKE